MLASRGPSSGDARIPVYGEGSGPTEVTPGAFVARLRRDGAKDGELSEVIHAALGHMLGEVSTVATLSYTGDVADGDLLAFATRIEELFGSSSAGVFDEIIASFEERAPRAKGP